MRQFAASIAAMRKSRAVPRAAAHTLRVCGSAAVRAGLWSEGLQSTPTAGPQTEET